MSNYVQNRRNPLGFIDPFFDEFFSERNSNSIMKTDIRDEGDHYLLKIDVPEIQKENIKISLQEGYLTVNATFTESNEDKNKQGKYLRRERQYGSYSRSFYIGEDVLQEDVKAKLENGVLTLKVLKNTHEKKVENHYINID